MVRRNTSTISTITERGQKPSVGGLPEVAHGVMEPANFREVIVRSTLLPCFLGAVGVFTAIAACSSSEARNCRVDADCASGVCGADGTCVNRPDSGTPQPIGTGIPEGDDDDVDIGLPDAGRPADDGGGYKAPGCIANHDGVITREEVPLQAGLHAIFRFATNVDIGTQGEIQADGTRKWDLTTTFASDANVLIETKALTGQWFEEEYKDATYYTPLGKSPDVLAIFDNASGSLVLKGAVSTAGTGATKIDLKNASTVRTLDFGEGGLKMGKKWTDKTLVTGVSPTPNGTGGFNPSGPIAYLDKYDNSVDAEGELVTPLGKFQVLRVRIDLTRTIPFDGGEIPAFTTRTYAFVTECYGNVGSIVSGFNEQQEEFTHAAEIRRISP